MFGTVWLGWQRNKQISNHGEIDLETLGKAQRKTVRATLNRLREAAVEEAHAPDTAIQRHVDGLLQEAEKSLKSLKTYTWRLATENKSKDEKIKTWESLVKKVNKKFTNCVEAMANETIYTLEKYKNKNHLISKTIHCIYNRFIFFLSQINSLVFPIKDTKMLTFFFPDFNGDIRRH